MTDIEREKYYQAYYDNEADANKQMSFANAAAALYMLVLWIFYLTGFFKVHSDFTLILINIAFPIGILILLTPLLYVYKFKHILRKPNYKYFVLATFVLVIGVLNTILPIHSAIAWALCIIMTNHYYNQKVGLAVFISVMVLSIASMYGAMFVGEYDANLLLGNDAIKNGVVLYEYGPEDRLNMLKQLMNQGYNRYLEVLYQYYGPRAVILVLIFFVSNALNKRTYKLLVSEINVSNEQAKTNTELEVAKDIQLATLPVELVTNEDIEIQAELRAAASVGGDFYDYFFLDDSHVALLIGDVSGKGIPAAMFMMKTITCFRNYISLSKSPSQTLKEVNRVLNINNESAMFVTCFYAIVNTKTGEMKFANAGHLPPLIGQKGKYKFLKCNAGFVLGPLKEAMIKDETYQLNNGDTITLYTDGITEAKNEKGELYGDARLLALFNKKTYSCLVELHHFLKDDINRFIENAVQSDDITYITMKYHGDRYSFKEGLFKGVKDNIPAMLKYIEDFANEKNMEKGFVNNLSVVADEMLSNIVKYGYKDKVDDIFIRLLYNVDKKEFILTIVDKGEAFNPFEINNIPLEGDIENKKEGGLGILIVKKLMSEYAYDYINHKNIVTLKKIFL